MKLGQIQLDGGHVAAIFTAGGARAIPGHTMRELIDEAESEGVSLADLAERLAVPWPDSAATPAIPLFPSEVWGCGCTYETSASFRDGEQGTRDGMYAQVYRGGRPEIFFKGTSRVCAGPGEPIGIRSDSKFTAPEPELALILGSGGKILGYTLADDVSAWDIERENPLYLPQSKTYDGCCSLGPYIVTDLADPYSLHMTCTITRQGVMRFEGSTSTARLNRKFETLVEFLLRSNEVPPGAVVLTGTGIIVTEAAALEEGDTVAIEVPELGRLENTAKRC